MGACESVNRLSRNERVKESDVILQMENGLGCWSFGFFSLLSKQSIFQFWWENRDWQPSDLFACITASCQSLILRWIVANVAF